MPKYPMVQKTIKGKAVTQRDFRNAIIEIVRLRGEVKPIDVAHDLGREWVKPNASGLIGQTMANLTKAKILQKNDAGFYTLAPGYIIRGTGGYEDALEDVLVYMGGIARTRDLLESMDVRPRRGNEAAYSHTDYRSIFHTLKKSKRFRRYYKKGVWGLPWPKLLTLPLTGAWAEFLHLRGVIETGPEFMRKNGYTPELHAQTREHWLNVGVTFANLRDRHHESVETLLTDPAVRTAVQVIYNVSRGVKDAANHSIQALAEIEAAEAGTPSDLNLIDAVKQREMPHILEHVYTAFEQGSPSTHRAAPVILYRSVAAHFNVCPILLSHGMILKIPPNDDHGDLSELEIQLDYEAAVLEDQSLADYAISEEGVDEDGVLKFKEVEPAALVVEQETS